MNKLTPAMQQYMDIKNKHPDCVCLFRMGDFYETFFEDARIVSEALEITLTKRGNVNGKPIPLAGIPYHALDPYLAKLIKKGFKVAIVEQMEDPKLAKGVVKRDVVRIVTPGTVMEDRILDSGNNNYIACLTKDGQSIAMALIEMSTGEFISYSFKEAKLINELSRFAPAEIIFPDSLSEYCKRLKESGYFMTNYEDRHFLYEHAEKLIKEQFDVVSISSYMLSKQMVCACGALLDYLKDTQKTNLNFISPIRQFIITDYMELDTNTKRNLELTANIMDGGTKGTLLQVIDKTKTPMGRRLIKKWITQPLLRPEMINYRLDGVAEFVSNLMIREEVRELLRSVQDIERLLGRISFGNSNPRDLVALSKSLSVTGNIKNALRGVQSPILDDISKIDNFSELNDILARAIKDEPPVLVRDGGFIRDGYNNELDELRSVSRDSKQIISKMEASERAKTGIKSLRIRYNKVFGYYIEITNMHKDKVPDGYIRKQTMANAERYITDELKTLESKILNAEDKIKTLEFDLFMGVCDEVTKYTRELQECSHKIAVLDVVASFSSVSVYNNYIRPEIDTKYRLNIKEGRHPVIERNVDSFITNDIFMDEDGSTFIITGPNMAGKSTYMRQVALTIIMAQMGCFVPAAVAKIGVVDRVFTRVGASDDISSGQSTFMVEMTQTAYILNNATDRSFIILDEIGRGTSTFDGMALASSVAEYITRNIRAKTLFATHYHQLNNLSKDIKKVKNYNVSVVEKDNEVVFLHKIVAGGTDKSYGIHVAKLAGLPKAVLSTALKIQLKLEENGNSAYRTYIEKDNENTITSKQKGLNDFG
ncbi:DNA mismatch repair protein MutS [Candidatus Woesearchaeota archaeon]|nr:DNA mismatch repair protein MutS [Candidatus Woesearchaeota archaeon]